MRSLYTTIITAVLLIQIPIFTNGQACGKNFIPNFRKGNTDLSFGVGFGSYVVRPGSYTTVPFLNISVDHALRDDLGPGVVGVGGFIGYEQYRTDLGVGEYGYNNSSLVFQARATYHYQFIEDFDTYAGVGLGLKYINSSEFGILPVSAPDPINSVRGKASVFVGGKYFFNDNIAAFGELGIGVSILNLGITFRLK